MRTLTKTTSLSLLSIAIIAQPIGSTSMAATPTATSIFIASDGVNWRGTDYGTVKEVGCKLHLFDGVIFAASGTTTSAFASFNAKQEARNAVVAKDSVEDINARFESAVFAKVQRMVDRERAVNSGNYERFKNGEAALKWVFGSFRNGKPELLYREYILRDDKLTTFGYMVKIGIAQPLGVTDAWPSVREDAIFNAAILEREYARAMMRAVEREAQVNPLTVGKPIYALELKADGNVNWYGDHGICSGSKPVIVGSGSGLPQ